MRMAIPWVKADAAAIITPPIKTGRRPNRTISNDAGKVVSIEVTNCKDNPRVASHGKGDKRLPTSAVLMIFTFIVVIERACAAASLITLPVLLLACMIVMSKIGASYKNINQHSA